MQSKIAEHQAKLLQNCFFVVKTRNNPALASVATKRPHVRCPCCSEPSRVAHLWRVECQWGRTCRGPHLVDVRQRGLGKQGEGSYFQFIQSIVQKNIIIYIILIVYTTSAFWKCETDQITCNKGAYQRQSHALEQASLTKLSPEKCSKQHKTSRNAKTKVKV